MTSLKAEWMIFIQAVFSGIVVYWGYFCVRKFRRVFSHNLIFISIEDAVFWLATSIYLFVQIYYTSNGVIRWYFVLGVVFGALLIWRVQRAFDKKCRKKQNQGK